MTSGFDPRATAQRFWARAGEEEPFPRQLIQGIAAALPVAVVLLPGLSVATTADWLEKRRAGRISTTHDRALRGCLIAQRGHGFIFVDGRLEHDERRLTVAHELGHFLQHYEAPRDAALRLLGDAFATVLDGEREPTAQERLRGALRGASVGVYQHLLDRHDGLPAPSAARFEAEADLIAFELLAPCGTVARTTKPGLARRNALVERYGLPGWAADSWAAWIDARRAGDSFIGRLERARRKIDY